ncbi:MAG TPA: FkbM family methyltransferase [Candidatus Acidoferrum sp.]|nr:FkbM family methyltransferase [Candidatus Acidoferrum sp.]
MSAIRSFIRSCIVALLGKNSRPRKIIRGTASGYWMWISPAENLGYLLGTDEPHLQKAIRKHVSPDDTVYDIGANVGYVCLSLAKRVGPAGRVVAFEPVPRNLAALKRNIEMNGITNIQLWEAAASDRSGEAVLRIAENLSTASLVWHRNNPSATELRIRTVSIDELVERGEISCPKFIKIDVEGAEGGVSQGMRRTLAAARPVVFLECSEVGRETTWQLFHELNYRCQSAITGKWVDEFEAYRHSDFLWLPLPQ